MDKQLIFDYKTDISEVDIPAQLNNPFSSSVPEIARIAAQEFQQFIAKKAPEWNYDFGTQKGKMFGVLVVQKKDNALHYLGAVSGKIPGETACTELIPSVFDDSADDCFINTGMRTLTDMGKTLLNTKNPSEIRALTAHRKQKSLALQKQLFENYRFLNLLGREKNVLQIFKDSSHGKPPSAAGECAAPKLLNYAFKHRLKPMALAEFWWGNPPKNKKRSHQVFYGACKNKCRPILEYMLNDKELFNRAVEQ